MPYPGGAGAGCVPNAGWLSIATLTRLQCLTLKQTDVCGVLCLLQGTADVNVTLAMARFLATSIPGAHLPRLRALADDCWPDGSRVQPVPPDSRNQADDTPGLVALRDEGHMSLLLCHAHAVMRAAARMAESAPTGAPTTLT